MHAVPPSSAASGAVTGAAWMERIEAVLKRSRLPQRLGELETSLADVAKVGADRALALACRLCELERVSLRPKLGEMDTSRAEMVGAACTLDYNSRELDAAGSFSQRLEELDTSLSTMVGSEELEKSMQRLSATHRPLVGLIETIFSKLDRLRKDHETLMEMVTQTRVNELHRKTCDESTLDSRLHTNEESSVLQRLEGAEKILAGLIVGFNGFRQEQEARRAHGDVESPQSFLKEALGQLGTSLREEERAKWAERLLEVERQLAAREGLHSVCSDRLENGRPRVGGLEAVAGTNTAEELAKLRGWEKHVRDQLSQLFLKQSELEERVQAVCLVPMLPGGQ